MSLLRHAKEHLSNQSRYALSNAFISLTDRASVLARAEAMDKTLGARPHQTTADNLKGRLIGIKDNICTADLPTTAASGLLKSFTSPYDATVVKHLYDAGAIVAGKTNMDEFGMGSHSIHSAFGAVEFKRHEEEQLSAGGSSGGSAVAVATGQCWAALGTDTGGSVRLPAAYTGIVGFKPSYGLLSRWGVIAYANSLDTVGIMAMTVPGVTSIFSELNHHDPQDPTSLPPSTRANLVSKNQTVALRIGIPLEYNISTLSPAIRRSWIRSLRHLEAAGHTLHPVSLPTTQYALSAYYVLAPAEASSNLAKYDGVRYGSRAEGKDGTPSSVLFAKTRGQYLGAEVKRRILLGAFTLSADAIDNYFIQAQKVRRLVSEDFNEIFAAPNPLIDGYEGNKEGVDVLLCPTAPTLPPSLSEVKQQEPLNAYMNDVFTVPASLAGLPAISVPVHLDEEDRNAVLQDSDITETAGMQIIGQYGNDALVLTVAQQLTEARDQSIGFTEARDLWEKVTESGPEVKKKNLVKVPGYGLLEKYPSNKEKKQRKKFGDRAKELGMTVDEYVKIYDATDVSKPE